MKFFKRKAKMNRPVKVPALDIIYPALTPEWQQAVLQSAKYFISNEDNVRAFEGMIARSHEGVIVEGGIYRSFGDTANEVRGIDGLTNLITHGLKVVTTVVVGTTLITFRQVGVGINILVARTSGAVEEFSFDRGPYVRVASERDQGVQDLDVRSPDNNPGRPTIQFRHRPGLNDEWAVGDDIIPGAAGKALTIIGLAADAIAKITDTVFNDVAAGGTQTMNLVRRLNSKVLKPGLVVNGQMVDVSDFADSQVARLMVAGMEMVDDVLVSATVIDARVVTCDTVKA